MAAREYLYESHQTLERGQGTGCCPFGQSKNTGQNGQSHDRVREYPEASLKPGLPLPSPSCSFFLPSSYVAVGSQKDAMDRSTVG